MRRGVRISGSITYLQDVSLPAQNTNMVLYINVNIVSQLRITCTAPNTYNLINIVSFVGLLTYTGCIRFFRKGVLYS